LELLTRWKELIASSWALDLDEVLSEDLEFQKKMFHSCLVKQRDIQNCACKYRIIGDVDKEDIVCTKREEFSLRFELRTHDKTGITVFF
jgi:hypothetical protein